MPVRIKVNKEILQWALSRAGLSGASLVKKFPHIKEWLAQTKQPTIKQLAELSKKNVLA